MKQLPKTLKPHLKEGQRITVVGLGGVGTQVARNLAIFVASLQTPATLTLIDKDEFEPNNSTRMWFHDFGFKVEVVAADLLPRFVESELEVKTVTEYVTPANVASLIKDGDIVFLCLDNHASRKLISDWCSTMKNVVLISGGNDGVTDAARGTYGNVQVYIRKDGQDASPSLTEFHPEVQKPADKPPNELSCIEKQIKTPQLLISNLMVAVQMLSTFSLYISDCLHWSEICMDWADGMGNIVLDQDLPKE